MVRLTTAGNLDTDFNSTGWWVLNLSTSTSEISTLALSPTDAIVVAGAYDYASSMPFAVARLTAAGTLDPAFGGTGVVFTGLLHSVGVQDDDKVLVATRRRLSPWTRLP